MIVLRAVCNDWLGVLHASNQISFLEPWFGNFTKRLIKSPKLYFCDAGLLCFLLNLTPESLIGSAFLGAIWEGLVYSELRKLKEHSLNPMTLWMYRDSGKKEIDFLLQTRGVTHAIECKWHEIPTLSDAASILDLQEYLNKNPARNLGDIKAYVACRTPQLHPLGQGVMGLGIQHFARFFDLEIFSLNNRVNKPLKS